MFRVYWLIISLYQLNNNYLSLARPKRFREKCTFSHTTIPCAYTFFFLSFIVYKRNNNSKNVYSSNCLLTTQKYSDTYTSEFRLRVKKIMYWFHNIEFFYFYTSGYIFLGRRLCLKMICNTYPHQKF